MNLQNVSTFNRELSQDEIVATRGQTPRSVLENWITQHDRTITYWVKLGGEWYFRSTQTKATAEQFARFVSDLQEGEKFLSLALWERLTEKDIEQAETMGAAVNSGDLDCKLIEYHSFQEYAE